jgi:hypothetical protein
MPKNRRRGWRPDRILGMGNSDTVGEDGPGTGPPLTPEQFVKAMDVLASYVAGRGLPLLMTGHYPWMMRYLAAYFEHSDTPVSFTPGLPFLGKAVSFGPGPGRVTRPAIILAIVQVAESIRQLIASLAGRLIMSAVLSARAYVRTNAVAATPLIAVIVIVFLSGDSWKILGQGFDWQFGALLGFFLLLSVLVVTNPRRLKSRLSSSPGDLGIEASNASAQSLVAALWELGSEIPSAPRLSMLAATNVVIVYFGIVVANLLLVGTLVAVSLVLVGVIRIDATLTRQLAGGPAHILLHLPVGGMVITQELLSLSLTLGGLAILSFAVVCLQDRQARAEFANTATIGLRRVLYAYGVYQAALDNEAVLTGVGSRNK